MPEIPADLKFSQDHLWVRPVNGASVVRAGVTDFAQQFLGDVIESVKSVSDLIAPVTGTTRALNHDLARSPEPVNTDPYGQGWLCEVEIDPATLDRQLAALMDAGAYRDLASA